MSKQKWFTKVVVELESPLLSYVYKIVQRKAQTEETVQDGFFKLWAQEYPKFEDHYPKAWLYKVCRNLAIDYLRKEKRLETIDDIENVLAQVCINETLFDASVIFQEISQLPKAMQEAITLRFGNELSYKEIAEVMNLTPSNVGVKIHDGLQRIREVILTELGDLNEK